MKKISYYAADDDDGEMAYNAIMGAIPNGDDQDEYSLIMENAVAPMVKTILEVRTMADTEDDEYFISVASAIADMIAVVTEAAVSDGKEEFVKRFLKFVGSVVAHKIGPNSLPSPEECLDIIRRLYH